MTWSLNQTQLADLAARSQGSSDAEVRRAIAEPGGSWTNFAHLISPAASEMLETLATAARAATQQRFGKVIRLFAPLYLSNECINNCKYCGFSRDNPVFRVTLSVPQVVQEARSLHDQGFRTLLLVAGEHPKFISTGYMADCVRAVHPLFPSVSLEVGPMETPEYRELTAAGAEGLVVYQETYNREMYAEMHTAGPKRDYDWRLATAERAYDAGFRRLGIGALFGLADWREEALALAAHTAHLLKRCWKAQITISLPRLRPHAGEFEPTRPLQDRELAQLICAFRLTFPDVGLVLSTREPAHLRDGLLRLGVTHMSAGSHTEPGGYTGAGKENIHRTERGRIIDLDAAASAESAACQRVTAATGQFEIADERSPQQVAERLREFGYEPVWKDWDTALANE